MLRSLTQFNVYSVSFQNLNQIFTVILLPYNFVVESFVKNLPSKVLQFSGDTTNDSCSHRENAQEKKIQMNSNNNKSVLALLYVTLFFRLYISTAAKITKYNFIWSMYLGKGCSRLRFAKGII